MKKEKLIIKEEFCFSLIKIRILEGRMKKEEW